MTTNADKPFNSVVENTCEREPRLHADRLAGRVGHPRHSGRADFAGAGQVRRQWHADGLPQQSAAVGNGLEHVHRRKSGLPALAKLGK